MILAKVTVGDLVTLPTLPITVSAGYTLAGSTVRWKAWSGSIAAPDHFIAFDSNAENVTWTVAEDGLSGALNVDIRAVDWPASLLAITTKVILDVETEVSIVGLAGPKTSPRPLPQITAHPQGIV